MSVLPVTNDFYRVEQLGLLKTSPQGYSVTLQPTPIHSQCPSLRSGVQGVCKQESPAKSLQQNGLFGGDFKTLNALII